MRRLILQTGKARLFCSDSIARACIPLGKMYAEHSCQPPFGKFKKLEYMFAQNYVVSSSLFSPISLEYALFLAIYRDFLTHRVATKKQ